MYIIGKISLEMIDSVLTEQLLCAADAKCLFRLFCRSVGIVPAYRPDCCISSQLYRLRNSSGQVSYSLSTRI